MDSLNERLMVGGHVADVLKLNTQADALSKCVRLLAWLSLSMSASLAYAQSYDLPAMKMAQAPLVSPATAITYYTSGTTRSFSLPSVKANVTAGIRPAEIKELAKGLGATQIPASLTQDQYAQRVFEYVRQNIAITFMYGSQRGALGALVNQSGTAFDQAQLVVELLREGGLTGVNYEIGTIALSAAQFTAWTGISDATAACRLLADGGIPATVNGSSDPNCGMTGAVSSVELRHIWVTALSKKYDAAYKTHTTKTAIDLAAAMGCGTASAPTCGADATTALISGAASGTTNGVNYYQNLNAANFNNKMKSLAVALQTTLKQTYPNALLEDVIGGSAIDFSTLPTPGATLPYSSVSNTATLAEIPDQYRIKLRVNFDNITMNTTNVDVPHNVFFSDELYGKRMYLVGLLTNFAPGTPNTVTRRISLYVDHELLAVSTRTGGTANNTVLTLGVDHPYAANGGAYLDEQITQLTQSQQDRLPAQQSPQGSVVFYPTTVVSEWGAVGAGLATHTHAMEGRDNFIWNVSDPYALGHQWECSSVSDQYIPLMGPSVLPPGVGIIWPGQPFIPFSCLQQQQRTHVGNWLAQNGRMLELTGRVNSSVVLAHHILGSMISGYDKPGQLNVSSTLSVISANNAATDRQAVSFSLAALSSHLEANVFQQGLDTWEVSSATSLLVRSNEKGQRLLLATPANLAQVLSGQLQNYPSAVTGTLQNYVNGGASAILPQNWKAGSWLFSAGGAFGSASIPIDTNGYLAFQPAGNFIAHLVGVSGSKGGVGGAPSDINPAKAVHESVKQMDASLKSRKSYGVSLASGNLTLTPAPDLVVGAGGFPNSLAFQRVYDSSVDPLSHTAATWGGDSGNTGNPVSPKREYSPGNADQWLPGGWDYTLHIRAAMGSNSLQAMGEDSALDASATISALYVLRDLNRTLTTTPEQVFLPQLATMFTTYWWGAALINNSVVVRRPPASATFMRLPDGQFNPPPNSAEQLVQTNDRSLVNVLTLSISSPAPINFYNIGYAYGSVQFALTDSGGSVLNFGWQGTEWSALATARTFDVSSWVYPHGVRVDFDYSVLAVCEQGYLNGPYYAPPKRLTAVRNNLGQRLTFNNFYGYANHVGLMCGNGAPVSPTSVTDDSGRKVTITEVMGPSIVVPAPVLGTMTQMSELQELTFATLDSGGATVASTRYLYKDTVRDLNAARAGLMIDSWFTLTDSYPSSPLAKVQYDSLLRVASVDSAANNAAGTRPRTDYLMAGVGFGEQLRRGESIDPLGARHTTYFDKFGKDVQQIDALGRTTWKTYDSRQRLKSVISPEGNSTEYTYDVRSNILTEKNLPKPGSNWAATTITNTYMEGASVFPCVSPASCNQVKTSTDKKNRITDYDYYANGQIKQVKGPTTSSVRAESDYCYTNYTTSSLPVSLLTGVVKVVGGGKPNRVSTFTYNSANKYVLDTAIADPTNSLTTACAPTAKSGAKNLTSIFTFDALGNVSTVDGPRSDVSDVNTYTFDAMRRLKQVIGPSGTNAKTIYTYFDDGTLRYVDRQEMVGGSPVLRREERTYWPSGDLKAVQDPQGNLTQTNYDLAGRANLIIDPDGRRVGTAYDLAGQTRCVWKDWSSATAPGLWTTANPAVCNWNPADYVTAGNSGPYRYVAYTYTLNGKQATIQDAGNNQTNLVYDKHDRLRYTLFPSPSTGNRCTPTTSENVTALTCPAGATYEELRYSTSGAPATSTTGLCTGNDQVCGKRTRASQVIAYTYDAMNRIITKTVPGLPTVTFTYNLLSEPLSLTSPSQASPAIPAHAITYDYNDVGQKLFEQNTLNGTVRQVSYGYDTNAGKAGNRTSTTWPDGYVVSYEYDALNRMSKVWEGAPTTGIKLADYIHDELSRRKELKFANQSNNKATYTYELDSDLDVLTNVLNSVTVTLDYGHNNSGQITTIDANDGFYLPSKAIATTTAYVPNKLNQYGTVGGQTQTYDSNGNLLTWFPVGGQHTYTYDAENRLRTAAVNGSATATITYDYDPLGRRLSKTVSGTSTYYLLDGDEEIAEYSSGGTVLRRYITGPAVDDRIARAEGASLSNPTKHYYHLNHQGSVIGMTDSAGTITQKLAYDEYGNLTSDSPASPTGEQFRYTGRRYDDETKLYYYRARYYSPVLRRFLQVDPVGYNDDFNLFAYVGNDPVNKTDPSGNYGQGSGWDEDSWKKFNGTQQRTAADMEERAKSLEAKADKLDSKKKSGGAELRSVATYLRGGAAALRSDGSDGKMANRVDAATYVQRGGSAGGAARAEIGGNLMWINKDNTKAWKAGEGTAKFLIGHESLHTAGMGHGYYKNTVAYAFGEPEHIKAFWKIEGTPEAFKSPDNVMRLVYPFFELPPSP